MLNKKKLYIKQKIRLIHAINTVVFLAFLNLIEIFYEIPINAVATINKMFMNDEGCNRLRNKWLSFSDLHSSVSSTLRRN